MKKKLFVILGITLVILLALNVLLFGNDGVDLLFWIGLVFTLLMLFYPMYEQKMSTFMQYSLNGILFFGGFLTICCLVILMWFMIRSLPKEAPFEEKIVKQTIPLTEIEAYDYSFKFFNDVPDSITTALQNISLEYDSLYYGLSSPTTQVDTCGISAKLTIVDPYLESYLNYLASHIPSVHGPYTVDTPIMNYILLQYIYKAEIYKIGEMLKHGESEIATQKYQRLWQGLDNYLHGNQDGISIMCGAVLNGILVNFFQINYDLFFQTNDTELIDLSQNVANEFSPALKSAFYTEADFLKKGILINLNNLSGYIFDLFEFQYNPRYQGIYKRLIKWPFFDQYYEMKRVDEHFFQLGKLSMQDWYKISNVDWETKTEPIITSNWMGHSPIGSLLLSRAYYSWPVIVERKEEARSKIRMMHYLIEAKELDQLPDPPIDNLTGEPYDVSISNGEIIIESISKSNYSMIVKWPLTKDAD